MEVGRLSSRYVDDDSVHDQGTAAAAHVDVILTLLGLHTGRGTFDAGDILLDKNILGIRDDCFPARPSCVCRLLIVPVQFTTRINMYIGCQLSQVQCRANGTCKLAIRGYLAVLIVMAIAPGTSNISFPKASASTGLLD